jgi:hypothetical protein
MWVRFETYHAVTYSTPESRAATDALGCLGGWMGYFGLRAAPLGTPTAELVTALFYNFHPRRVARAIPDAWRIAAPEDYLRTRLAVVNAALRRLLGDDVLAGPEIAEAAALARQAAELTPVAGRPMAAANRSVPWPDVPHLVLWQATTLLREARGDGHVAALVASQLDPCETLVAFAADTGLDPGFVRAARGWSDEEWAAAVARLVDRGLCTEDGRLTGPGAELRSSVERRTDDAAAAPWQALGAAGTNRLADLLTPIAIRLSRDNEAMRTNPLGLDAAAVLAR